MIKVLKSVVVGPLEPYAAGFAAELERQGYRPGVAERQVGLAAHLSRWMAGVKGTGLEAEQALGQQPEVVSALCRGAVA